MPAYIVVQIEVTDPVRYEDYKKMVWPSINQYGGRFLVRGGRVETLEGDWKPARFVIIEFDNVERAKEWYASEEYREAKNLRHQTSRGQMILVEGVEK